MKPKQKKKISAKRIKIAVKAEHEREMLNRIWNMNVPITLLQKERD